MVFSSASFIFFFLPIFLLFDRLLKGRHRNYLLIFASILFYFWGEATGVLLLLALCLINFGLGKVLYRIPQESKETQGGEHLLSRGGHPLLTRKSVLVLGIVLNLSILFYFKYLAWILAELAALPFFPDIHIRAHALPLGISFFTFHAISYLIDIYKGHVKAHDASDFATYFLMFPHLVAGPIVRFEDVRQDIQTRRRDPELFAYGIWRFMLGVNKKVLIANLVAPIADMTFDPMIHPGFLDAWVGILAYTVQIYFDFSGYSDMAVGLAAMMGIRFKENFNSPYTSGSVKEFWRRWHISLSSWLRDYLYFPLGGSRTPKVWMTYRNLLIVFLLCGLWHGAQFTYVLWGLFHGMLLIAERTRFGAWIGHLPIFVQRLYCLFAVVIGWVFFRAVNLTQAFDYLTVLFNPFTQGTALSGFFGFASLAALGLGLAIALFAPSPASRYTDLKATPLWLIALNLILFVLSCMILYTNSRNPFIYFNF